MTDTLPDLRDRLAARAAATPLEVAAARARLEGRMVRAARPRRPGRRVLVAAVAAVVVAGLAATVVAVVHEQPTSGPAANAGPLPLTDWLFTVRAEALPSDLDVVEYVRATPDVQIAAVLRPGDASTSNAFTAVVELAPDPSTIGLARPPHDAVALEGDAWMSTHPDDEYGVSGVQIVWTDSAGRTARVVAPDDNTATAVRAAVDLGNIHPVRFPVVVPANWLPQGSTVASIDFTGTQGVEVQVDVPGGPPIDLAVAAPGVFVDDHNGGQVTTAPFARGFRITTVGESQVLHSSEYDLRVLDGRWGSGGSTPFPVDRVRTLAEGIRGVPMTLFPDQSTWFPLVAAVAVGGWPPRRHRPACTLLAPAATGLAVTALWAALGLVRQHTMRTGIDLGLYTQAVAGYAHGHLPWAALKTADGRFDLLGDHFTPVMALLAPAYRVWAHPSTLIVAQAVLVGIGVGVLARTVSRVFGTAAAGVAVGLALGLSWGVAGLALFDVHEVAFAVPLLAVVVDRAVADRWGAAVTWALPLLLVKEDSAFLLAGLGLACWAVGRRRLGAATCGVAVVAWWATTGVVIPALSWSGTYTYWSALGAGGTAPLATAGRVALAATSTPGLTLLAMLLATSLGLAGRSPLVWVAVPPLLARFGTAHAGYWGPGYHYDATLVVVLLGAAVDAVHRGWWAQWRPRTTRVLPAALLTVGLTLAWWSPLQGATQAPTYACPRCADARSALALVPDGADVAADTYLVDQLVDRTTVRLLAPGLRDSVGHPLGPGWVVADRRSAAWAGGPRAVDAVLAVAAARGCRTVHDAGGYVVLRCPGG